MWLMLVVLVGAPLPPSSTTMFTPGVYSFYNYGSKGELVLRRDGTYTLCYEGSGDVESGRWTQERVKWNRHDICLKLHKECTHFILTSYYYIPYKASSRSFRSESGMLEFKKKE